MKRCLSLLLALVMVLSLLPTQILAAETEPIVLETGDVASYPADMYLAKIELAGISGTVSGEKPNWAIELPEDTDPAQPITITLTSSVRQPTSLYFWVNDTRAESPISEADPWSTSVVPAWDKGRATLVVGAGNRKKLNGEKYTIELSIKGQTAADHNTVKLEEDKDEKYFVKQIGLSGADATASAVSDTDFSNGTKNHKATVEYTLSEMPSAPVTLTFAMMDDSKSYMTCNGSDRAEGKGTHTVTVDLSQGTVYTFVTYSSKSSDIVRGTYTVKFKVLGMTNAAPVLKDSSVTEVAQTLTVGKTFTLDVASLFRDPEQEAMTYTVSVNGAEPVEAAGSYSRLMDTAGDYTLVFRANDGNSTSEDSYTVKLKVPENTAPALTGEASGTATVMQYNAFKLDLSTVFADAEGDAMTYTVKIGDGAAQNAAANYSYTPTEDGEVTLVFQAKDHALVSAEYTVKLTVTYAPRTIINTTCTGRDTGDTWMQSVTVTGGEVIGYLWNVDAGHTESGEHVLRIRLADTVADDATLQLAYARGVASSGFNGTVSGPAAVTLADGVGSAKVTAKGWMDRGVTKTYTIYFTNKPNNAPVATAASSTAEVNTGADFTVDLTTVFSDPDGDALTYAVTIDGETTPAEAVYTRTMGTSGDIELVFTATDVWQDTATHTVTVTVTQSDVTYDAVVNVPAGITPTFYTTSSFDEVSGDTCGDVLTATVGTAAEGFVPYTVKVPENVTRISVRGVDAEGKSWGGMSFEVSEGAEVSVRQVKLNSLDYNDQIAVSTNTVTYGGIPAVAGEAGWLLAAGQEYVYQAVPADTAMVTTQKTEILPEGSEVYTVEIPLDLNNPTTITVPTGAVAQLYLYNQYYSNTEYPAKRIKDNGDGTTTYSFIEDASKPGRIYRVSMDGKITKAGWLEGNVKNVTVTYSDSDKAPSYRLDDYTGTGAIAAPYMEDSVLLNINSRNHLSLSVGQTKTLKAYRAWEIIPVSYNNWIIPPDFHYTILSGSDVVSLTERNSPSAGDGDWMTLTALKEGTAVIEVTYDAIDVNGGRTWLGGVYGASDPARSGLVVVQVGDNNDTSVNFGIECFASAGKVGSSNVSYHPDSKKSWDAEFDTLYFTGSSGELKLTPSASSAISEVAVSHDKGASWNVLTGENGTYTAEIVSGNNIIRVTTASGTAYQVVRGDKLSVSLKEVEGKSDGDGIVEAGETIRVTLNGLHAPIPKMAGNYNPGYGGNSDGYSSQHLNYTANGKAIWGVGSQYSFITASNYVDIIMPDDGSSVTLTDGYIGLGVIGLTGFADGGNSHRNIPDGGCGTRGSSSTWHTRSVLPRITVNVGNTSAPNSAPVVQADAVAEGSIFDDQKYAINPDTLFRDPDGNSMTFTVSVDGGAAETVGVDYKFTPDHVGTFTLTFTASDGKLSATHTVTVTVTERPKEEEKDETFGLQEAEIAGYVTVSIVDSGVRVAGETGLKYPVPLGTVVSPTKVPFKQGENMAQVTKRLLDHLGMGMSYSGTLTDGFYLGAISNFEVDGTPYASMGEFDAGVGSGWMVTLNDWFINMSASEFAVKDGDSIQWKYTCQLGTDIGDSYYSTVKAVENLIDQIGTVTAESEDAILAARAAYNALPSDQKSRVANYGKLTDAEAALAKLQKEADEAAAKQVSDLFDKLNSNSTTFEEDVKQAQQAYDKLTDAQKKLVTNYQKLADALKELASDEDKEKAEAVEKLIQAIGAVTKDSADQIKAARDSYEKLTDAQKALVGNAAALEEAESKLAGLQAVDRAKDIYHTTGNYLQNLGTPVPGSIGGEWMVIGLIRSDRKVDDAYYEAAVKYVKENADENGRLHSAKSTENSRLILALTAMGKDVTDVGGVDLLAGLNEMSYLRKQGNNGPVWALIAFDSGNYPTPAGDVTRESLIRAILDARLPDGGWALSGDVSDVDMIGMALQALAPYYASDKEVRDAVDMALEMLSEKQNADGSFTSIDGANSESAAQVIVALSALGIDAHADRRFVKNGHSALDALCAYYVEGGGFRHIPDGKPDGMATEQGYYALTAYFRMLDGKTALYDMTDVVDMGAKENAPADTLPDPSDPDGQGGFPWWILLVVLAAGAVIPAARKRKK